LSVLRTGISLGMCFVFLSSESSLLIYHIEFVTSIIFLCYAVVLVNHKDIKSVGALPMVQLRGNTLPLISLQEKFELPAAEIPVEEVFVVVVGLGNKTFGLIVDGLRGQQEIVIKSLGDVLNNLPGIAGATILGDGKVTLILDIGSLIQDVLVVRKN
ncbi:MAG: chemotaxis protein CheW, partial [Desulfitobacteriaceae bacterium]